MFNLFLLRLFFVIVLFSFSACQTDYVPKPRAYFRIHFPEKTYKNFQTPAPYTFDYPIYASVEPFRAKDSKPYWYDLAFKEFNGRIHLSYYPIRSQKDFNSLIEDARSFAFKHTVKATAIDEARIYYPDKHVYGVCFSIAGNTASSIQFYLTDSVHNYLRGALYFKEKPRLDSIQPILDFLKKDIQQLIKTFEWKSVSK